MQLQVDCSPVVKETDMFVVNLEEVHSELKRSIEKAQHCYQKPADQQHILAPNIKIGDYVFILAKFILPI